MMTLLLAAGALVWACRRGLLSSIENKINDAWDRSGDDDWRNSTLDEKIESVKTHYQRRMK